MDAPRKGPLIPYENRYIQWISPMHCLLLVGYDDTHYIFHDPQQHALTYYSKESVQKAYDGLFQQAVVILNDTPDSPYPIHKYGSVVNPVTNEVYPIMVYENGRYYSEPNYIQEINSAEEKPTKLYDVHFDHLKFLAGLAFDDSLGKVQNHPTTGLMAGVFKGCITGVVDNLETVYFTVQYYKVPETGQKQAIVRCGESKYRKMFADFEHYGIPVSLKGLHGRWSGSNAWAAAVWEVEINKVAQQLYGEYKGITPNTEFEYDLEYTFNQKRKDDQYISQIFLDKDGKVYEYATIYPNEKIEIVVTDKRKEIERLNILPLIGEINQLTDQQTSVLNIQMNA